MHCVLEIERRCIRNGRRPSSLIINALWYWNPTSGGFVVVDDDDDVSKHTAIIYLLTYFGWNETISSNTHIPVLILDSGLWGEHISGGKFDACFNVLFCILGVFRGGGFGILGGESPLGDSWKAILSGYSHINWFSRGPDPKSPASSGSFTELLNLFCVSISMS